MVFMMKIVSADALADSMKKVKREKESSVEKLSVVDGSKKVIPRNKENVDEVHK